ncbi:acyltransferase family protein [Streptomyces zingiberis]|uniref:Acyltransferase n=1 Tax=Streptomyces zingiberis TaxID=2053010 RepID=A0ABX1C4C2_9ACTN|nr:acyltransferase [Streptomyces zingiberis]NJQ02767.1 acyltransferase [Streptomyces zingiberis]
MSPESARAAGSAAPREHRYDIDLIRLLCSCGVILGHVGSAFIAAVAHEEANGPAAYWAGMTADAISRFAVPMYFAIAGWAVLVGAPPRDGRRVWQRIVKIGIPLAVWTAVYLLWGRLTGSNEDPLRELAPASLLASVRPAYHLWYLYTYLPVISLLACAALVRAGRRPWGLAAGLLGLAVAPQLLADLGVLTGWDMPRFGWGFVVYQIVYAVVGALLFALPAGAAGRRWPWAVVTVAAVGGILWYQHAVHYVIPNAHLLVALLLFGALLSLHRIRVPERLRPALGRLAAAAYGAYLVHVLVIDVLAEPVVSPRAGVAGAALLTVALTVATVVVSFGASLAWGRLGLRRWLG